MIRYNYYVPCSIEEKIRTGNSEGIREWVEKTKIFGSRSKSPISSNCRYLTSSDNLRMQLLSYKLHLQRGGPRQEDRRRTRNGPPNNSQRCWSKWPRRVGPAGDGSWRPSTSLWSIWWLTWNCRRFQLLLRIGMSWGMEQISIKLRDRVEPRFPGV